jgi:F-type H+-transporting ATPase subunit alpha
VGRVTAFETQYLSELKAREPGILTAIRTDLEIKQDTEKKLVGFLDNFTKNFT